MKGGAFILCVAICALSCSRAPFPCAEDRQCVDGEQKGTCETNHRCSFPDPACPSAKRYAPFGTDETCVAKPPPCTIAGIAAGGNNTCAWFSNGSASCWGEGASGQLGDATATSRSVPKAIDGLAGVIDMTVGGNHICATLGDHALSCWGENAYQQLGDGTAAQKNIPTKATSLPQVAHVDAGGHHSCAKLPDGGTTCLGRNTTGQLGDGSVVNRGLAQPIAILKKDVLELAAGDAHTCALMRDGAVFCWGSNRVGAVAPGVDPIQGLPVTVPKVPPAVHLTAGENHNCALSAEGTVTCWGANDLGQIGDKALGRVVEPIVVPGIAGAIAIDAGGGHTCAVLRDNTGRCWGSNSAGQLGNGKVEDFVAAGTAANLDTVGALRQLVTGTRHTCALTQAGDVFCWGRTLEGQLADGIPLLALEPGLTVNLDQVAGLAVGQGHVCAVRAAGDSWCWGRGDFGELGNGDTASMTEPAAVGASVAPTLAAVEIVSGNDFSCARMADGFVTCWGRGNRGQLGNKATADHARTVPVMLPDRVTAIAAGTEHACAVLVTGDVQCWGETAGGRLGNNVTITSAQTKPTPATTTGDFTQVAAGTNHTCGLTKTGAVLCWGLSNYGQAGAALGQMAPVPAPVLGLPEVAAIASGADHMCALAKDSTVWCWGRGDVGQLGWGTANPGLAQPVQIPKFSGVIALAAGGQHTCALKVGGLPFCWGSNRYGQLGTGNQANRATPTAVNNLVGVKALDAGERNTCAVTTAGKVWCWGSDQYGQLGTGKARERAEPRHVDLLCK